MGAMAFQITNLTIVYSTVYSGVDQRKHQSSTSLAFVRGIHRWPVNSPHNGPKRGKCFHLMTSSWIAVHTYRFFGIGACTISLCSWVMIWWRHQMKTLSAFLAICASLVTGEFPAKRPVTRGFDVFFDLRLYKNGWLKNREAGDLRRHRTQYDVIIMK